MMEMLPVEAGFHFRERKVREWVGKTMADEEPKLRCHGQIMKMNICDLLWILFCSS